MIIFRWLFTHNKKIAFLISFRGLEISKQWHRCEVWPSLSNQLPASLLAKTDLSWTMALRNMLEHLVPSSGVYERTVDGGRQIGCRSYCWHWHSRGPAGVCMSSRGAWSELRTTSGWKWSTSRCSWKPRRPRRRRLRRCHKNWRRWWMRWLGEIRGLNCTR